MIAAIDVYYTDDGSAVAGAVIFKDYSDPREYRKYTCHITETKAYIPGEFYKRELPCIIAVLEMVIEDIDTVIIDGYVDLGEKPGLGRHLWKALDCRKDVIGVAKKYFRGSDAIKVFRGGSRRPLYVTSAGIEISKAAGLIQNMYGRNRIPDLLKMADSLCRRGTNGKN